MRAALLSLVLALPLAACARKTPGAPAAAIDASTAEEPTVATTAPDASKSVELASGTLLFPDAIRAGQWEEAEAAIGRLSPAEQARPEIRYARARVAMNRGAHAAAITSLEKLEDELPLLRDSIVAMRADAMAQVGPYDKAAELLAARGTTAATLAAAESWLKANDTTRARAMCDRVVADPKRTRAQEERARFLRMPIVRDKDGDAPAAADARWLAVRAFEEPHHRAAVQLLETLGKPLTGDEHHERAKLLAAAGRTEEALRAVERADRAKPSPPALDLCRTRADAYFRAAMRNRYPEAAIAYQQCSHLGGPHVAEDMFLAGRAFSRADRDVDAVTEWRSLLTKHPKSPFAEEAEFHIARTHALAGRWREAAQAFDDYKKHFPNGKEKREADRYRAVAHLLAKDHKIARKLLEELSGTAEDAIAQARWINLAALAALRDGDRTHALGRWGEVARSRPLSWPALVARARLTQAQAPLPLTIDPPETGSAPEPLPPVELPAPASLLRRVGLDVEAEEALRARESVVTGKSNGRGTEALCNAYAELDRGKRRFQLSLQLPGTLFQSAPGPKNRWAWECAYPRPHKSAVRESATQEAPVDLIWAVMRQESNFDPEALSPARAVGLMQLLPETARTVASANDIAHDDGKLTVPAQNIRLGALYLKELHGKLKGSEPLAVASYNVGPEAITRWVARSKTESIDIFLETIPVLETRGYVVRVMSNLARYGYLEKGEPGVPRVTLELPALREEAASK